MITGAGGTLMVMVRFVLPVPPAPVALMVTVLVAPCDGMPLMMPVAAVRLSPAGNEPVTL